jgi:hypothetical protein
MIEWLKDTLKDAGLEVHGVKGWRRRGHPVTFTPIGVMIHHTASNKLGGNAPSLNTVTFGRPDLPGPLSNVVIARDASCFIIAAGYCYHAGEGGPWRNIPVNSGNRYLVGFECENDGIGEPWPLDQLKAMHKATAAVLDKLKHGAGYCVSHKEWTPRKIDPARLDMDHFRDKVRTYL